MQIITVQVDRRLLMAFGLMLLAWALLTMLEEKKRKAMCQAILQRQDELSEAMLHSAALSHMAIKAAEQNRSAAQPKKTATRRK